MALDGIFIRTLVTELNTKLSGAYVNKITQPEPDELLFTLKNNGDSVKLFLSADASMPLVYLTKESKESPLTAPVFCMLLRKHLQGARIISVTQPGLERIIRFEFEHLDELRDARRKVLVMELMGKHSNIIFVDDKDVILDSIRHVSPAMSSLRTVLPGRPYFIAPSQDKKDITFLSDSEAAEALRSASGNLSKAVSATFTGVSKNTNAECLLRAGLNPDLPAGSLSAEDTQKIIFGLRQLIQHAAECPTPVIYSEGGSFKEFTQEAYGIYSHMQALPRESASELLETYFATKNKETKMKQRSADLRKLVSNILEKEIRKSEIYRSQLAETEQRDTLRLYGELLQTYGYGIEPEASSVTVNNYYTGEDIEIPLDPSMTGIENSKAYFARYSKLKRTFEAVTDLCTVTDAEIEHLRSIMLFFDTAENEEDLKELRDELYEAGYMKAPSSSKKGPKIKAGSPMHFLSSDGFDIYVGKNNIQNDNLSFKLATGNDWWFHVKKAAGSHVIVKAGNRELPDRTFEEAARLAAHFSSVKDAERVEVDYTMKKNLKRPAGAVPGYVIYHTNYSMMIDTDITAIQRVRD